MIRVDGAILSGPSLDVAMDGVLARLKAAGWPAKSYGSGAATWYPSTVPVHFVFDRPDTAANRAAGKAAVVAAVLAPGAWYSTAADFTSSGWSDVVAPTAETASNAVAKAGEAAADAAKGVGIGAGIGLVVLAGAAVFLYVRGGR